MHDGHIPTPYHHDIFPPGGNMSGGNLLASHDDGDLVIKTHVARRLVASLVKEAKGTHPVLQKKNKKSSHFFMKDGFPNIPFNHLHRTDNHAGLSNKDIRVINF